MKRTAPRARRMQSTPTDAEHAMWGNEFADTFEDRVSESLVDYDDEREVVEAVVPGMNGSVH